MPKPYKAPLERKTAYVDSLASDEGIHLSMLTWEFELPVIQINISFNVLFNFQINLYLGLNLHFDLPELDFEIPRFGDFFIDTETGLTFNEIDLVEKAKFGVSRYSCTIHICCFIPQIP